MPFSWRMKLWLVLLIVLSAATACSEGVHIDESVAAGDGLSELDRELLTLTNLAGLAGNAAAGRNLPSINDPVAQLGKDLFFTRGLGGNFEVACVTCHHPQLGGGDGLSLSVGVGATNPTVLGPGRTHADSGHPNVPRNAPTVFNAGLWNMRMFWDGRVEVLGPVTAHNGEGANIRTPDSVFGQAAPAAGRNLATAQSKFPVTSAAEMRTDTFIPDASNEDLRQHLAARMGNYGIGTGELAENNWLERFRVAFDNADGNAQTLVTFDNIAFALGEYERSMVFTNHPFSLWLQGQRDALTDSQKRGAILFYRPVAEGGAGCANCHTGDFFTDEQHHVVASIQIGEGKGDGDAGSDDFGRERESGERADRYRFRTPSLLNVSATAPYGHAGAYDTLSQVIAHYVNPSDAVDQWFAQGGLCAVQQFSNLPDCATLYPNIRANSVLSLAELAAQRASETALFQDADLSNDQQADLVAFLESLTDPCVEDLACLAPWIANPDETGPDGMQLNGSTGQGAQLGR